MIVHFKWIINANFILTMSWLNINLKLKEKTCQGLSSLFSWCTEKYIQTHTHTIFSTWHFLMAELINNYMVRNITDLYLLRHCSLLWSVYLFRNTMPWPFLMNTMTFMKRKWVGSEEKGYKQMFSQIC